MTRELLEQPQQGRVVVQGALPYWQREVSLVQVRGKVALARLPAPERKAWEQLWAEVAALLKQAKGLK
jgi:hypothetical protein